MARTVQLTGNQLQAFLQSKAAERLSNLAEAERLNAAARSIETEIFAPAGIDPDSIVVKRARRGRPAKASTKPATNGSPTRAKKGEFQQAILDLLDKSRTGTITNAEVVEKLGDRFNTDYVSAYLKRMATDGVISHGGRATWTKPKAKAKRAAK